MFNYYNYEPSSKKRRSTYKAPSCTLTEFARSVGITHQKIRERMKKSECKPQIMFTAKNNKYYAISDLKAWHNNYKGSKGEI